MWWASVESLSSSADVAELATSWTIDPLWGITRVRVGPAYDLDSI